MSFSLASNDINFITSPYDSNEESVEILRQMNIEIESNSLSVICGDDCYDLPSINMVKRILPAKLSPPLRTPLRSICPERKETVSGII